VQCKHAASQNLCKRQALFTSVTWFRLEEPKWQRYQSSNFITLLDLKVPLAESHPMNSIRIRFATPYKLKYLLGKTLVLQKFLSVHEWLSTMTVLIRLFMWIFYEPSIFGIGSGHKDINNSFCSGED
jgi:hypothetical protein